MSESKKSKYAYEKKIAWESLTKDQIKKAFDFAEYYKTFLNKRKLLSLSVVKNQYVTGFVLSFPISIPLDWI